MNNVKQALTGVPPWLHVLQDPRHRPSCAEIMRLTELQLQQELSCLHKTRNGSVAQRQKLVALENLR